MVGITTADIRAHVAQRQAATSIAFKEYQVKRKDGTTTKVPERTREISGAPNAEINRELTLLKRMFGSRLKRASCFTSRTFLSFERTTRTGFFESEQFASVVARLTAALKPVIGFCVHHRLAYR
jgi:hypothetical protein